MDPSAALPVLGASGVTPDMPSGVPKGSITAEGPPNASTHTETGISTGTGTGTTAVSASSATAHSAAEPIKVTLISVEEAGFAGMMIALMIIGGAVAFWL